MGVRERSASIARARSPLTAGERGAERAAPARGLSRTRR